MVIPVGDRPTECLPGFHPDIDIGFRAYGGRGSPKHHLGNGPIPGDADPGTRLHIFHPDTVADLPPTGQIREIGLLPALERPQEDNPVALHGNDVTQPPAALRGQRIAGDRDPVAWAGGLVVYHKEIMVVHARLDHLVPRIFQGMAEHQLRLPLGQAKHFVIVLRVPGILQYMGKRQFPVTAFHLPRTKT